VLISGGQVVLPVYKFVNGKNESYSGNDTVSLNVSILSTNHIPTGPDDYDNEVADGTASATFTDGIGTATFSD
jgi:hypothetical protein